MKEQGQKLVAAGATILVAEPAMQLAHFGGTGVIVGLAAGAVAYLVAEEVQQVKQAIGGDDTPSTAPRETAPREKKQPAAPGRRSLLYRLVNGKSTRGDDEQASDYEQPGLLRLSPELVIEPDELVCKSLFIAGQRRSGKTNLGARIAEQVGALEVPLFIPDSEGDYLTVYDFLPNGVIAGAPGSYDETEVDFWPVTPEDADVLGFNILYERKQVILDMNTFEDPDDAWRVVIGVIKGLFEFARQYPQYRCPVEVFLDEAQKYLPQNIAMSHIRDTQLRDQLLQAYSNVLTTGGKRGITPVILSQRFAETNNQIMAQSEIRFILRQTHDTDLARAMKYVQADTATQAQIASFVRGQGVFVGDDGAQFVTRFYERESDGGRSGTPRVEDARRQVDKPLPARYAAGAARSSWSPLPEPYEAQNQSVRGVQAGGLSSRFYDDRETPQNVRTFPGNAVRHTPEPLDVTTGERPREYRLSEEEIQQFITAYKVSGSIDKSLSALGRGMRYRAHASKIVSAYNLRQNA